MITGVAAWGPVALRVGAGVVFLVHGYPKLFGPQPGPRGFAQSLQARGFAPPLFWAFTVAIAEFVGGIFLLVGLLTRLVALVLAIEFLVIILKVKWPKGFGGWEYDWTLLAMMVALLLTGPGRWALDHALRLPL